MRAVLSVCRVLLCLHIGCLCSSLVLDYIVDLLKTVWIHCIILVTFELYATRTMTASVDASVMFHTKLYILPTASKKKKKLS